MTTQYYLWLLNKDLELVADSGLSRPKLNDKNQNPGEHWRKALEIAKGDSHLAARMISMLGHDDAMKEPLSISPTTPGYDEYLKVRKEIFERAIEKAKIKNPSIVSDLMSSTSSNVLRVFKNSTLFSPKSIGPDIDISDELKSRIISVQSKDGKSNTIPAKAYHFLGSINSACAFIEKSQLGISTGLLNPMLAGFYRGMRMGEIIDGERLSDRYSEFFKTSKENFILGAQKAKKFLEPHKNVFINSVGDNGSEKTSISVS